LSPHPANLSLDQAPPISAPLRFFLTAPVLGLGAAVLGLVAGPELYSSRWNPYTLAVTHLLTLGFMAQIMCGAILQILPVVAGAAVPRVTNVAGLSHPLLTAGTLLLAASLLSTSSTLSVLAGICLTAGFLVYLFATGLSLWRKRNISPVFLGITLALCSLLLTLILGLSLLASIRVGFVLPGINMLADIHVSWGLFGWVGLLLISIAYQVVPMFQVTPEYPLWMKKWLILWLFCGLLLYSGLQAATVLNSGLNSGQLFPVARILIRLAIFGGFVVFVLATLHLQSSRKRRITDVTLLFWRLAMYCAILAFGLWLLALLLPTWADSAQYPLLLGILLIPGFGCSVMNGMLYKIVPFLSWFHLQNRQLASLRSDIRLPNMKQIISDTVAKRQLQIHAAALLATIPAVFWPQWLGYTASVLFGLSWLLLGSNLRNAVRRYHSCYRQLTSTN